jgi:hypothetical protein
MFLDEENSSERFSAMFRTAQLESGEAESKIEVLDPCDHCRAELLIS